MQRMILLPADRYERMLASYDEAMEELREVRQQLETVKGGIDYFALTVKILEGLDQKTVKSVYYLILGMVGG